ncbi:MAG: hypothetical protein PF904_07985 [Kiritimatiellae bacterium]|jgi:hypothetical protein|nr:hypothetical protein [Kiritimatiellia bacterium]
MIHFITWLLSPFNLFFVLLFIGLFGKRIKLFKADSEVGYKLACVAFWGLFLISQPLFVNLFGTFLEYPYPYIDVERQPRCDVIVLLACQQHLCITKSVLGCWEIELELDGP